MQRAHIIEYGLCSTCLCRYGVSKLCEIAYTYVLARAVVHDGIEVQVNTHAYFVLYIFCEMYLCPVLNVLGEGIVVC